MRYHVYQVLQYSKVKVTLHAGNDMYLACESFKNICAAYIGSTDKIGNVTHKFQLYSEKKLLKAAEIKITIK